MEYRITMGTQQFTFRNRTAQAMIVDNTVLYAFFAPVAPYSTTLAPLTQQQDILEADRSYYSSLGYSPGALSALPGVHQGILSIRDSRLAGEAACRILLGTDRNPCTNFTTCQYACYSVTSFCMVEALGAGRDFINLVWDFENNSILLGRAYDAENSSFAAYSQDSSPQSAYAYLQSLYNLNTAATSAASSPLYTWYSYCFSPDYSLANLTSLQLSAQDAYQNASHFFNAPSEAGRVLNLTLEGVAKQNRFELPSELAAASKSLASLLPATNSSSPAQSPAGSSFLLQAAAITGAFLLFLAVAFLAGVVLLRKRRHKRP